MTKNRVCANTPAVPAVLSRRTLLAALPASGVAMAMPEIAPNATPDPVALAYQDWLAARRELRALADTPEHWHLETPEAEAVYARKDAAEERMLAHTPTTQEGIAALVAFSWAYTIWSTDPADIAQEAKSYECRAMLGIWQACTGKAGYPDVGAIV
ncbi:MAG: hypothetical protein ACPGFC_09765 [Paracoccaceae bacterium]